MKIFVGKWDLLPPDWEGANGLYEKDRFEIEKEVAREIEEYAETHHGEQDLFIGSYYPFEFEDTFNQDLGGRINSQDYWLKFIL